ncbi:MAG: S-layer homology domain-containing protein [Phascolarctobacterium sp.]|uniref:S-layer homology domain-containing protein n=1 Tax=Phascolarctobacterium sp. TaxID=2049039 RepID=UPI0026DBE7D4|nr:S-layer homology domain-containing protein [Phascolarctobacterium sp.]MDO4920388.1 S-layer homology domain-containing protein [Phascolarctobacterium sp.]
MKKSLVLAMAMALGVTASAYAANPFSDVPAGHWAYDSVNKLAAAGVIDGYGDATFGGDKLMTRYEMAQIVAKAMAKGANVDKLAAEFADELDTLGVRVANLEKKADNVKIAGQVRLSYRDSDQGKHNGRLRTRLFVKGAVNDDWTYTARIENNQYFDESDETKHSKGNNPNAGDEDTKLNWAFVSGRVGGIMVDAGRQDIKMHTGTVVDETFDAAKISYGKDVKLTGVVAKAAGSGSWDNGTMEEGDRMYVADVTAKLGVVDGYVTYYKADTANDDEIIVVGASAKIAKDLKLTAEYLNGDAQSGKDDNGYMVGLAYGGAKAAKAGSWGLYANYYDQPIATMLEHTVDGYAYMPTGFMTTGDGFQGYEIGANYTAAKNIVLGVKYYDLEAREGSADDQTIWTEVVFSF